MTNDININNLVKTDRDFNALDVFELNSNARKEQIEHSLNHHVVDGKIYDSEGTYIGDRYSAEWLTKTRKDNSSYVKFKDNQNYIEQHNDMNGGFVFAIFEANSSMLERFPSLNKKDIARLLYLATYIHYETGRLQKGDGTRITLNNVHTMIKMNARRSREYINKLVKANVLKIANDELYMSPDVFFRGQLKTIKPITKNKQYIRLFKNTVRNLFENAKENELAHISMIYAVLPYINLNHNYICHNPSEQEIEQIHTMEVNELADKIGYHRVKLTPALRKLRIDERPVFAFFDDSDDARKKYIVVNPNIVYGGNNAKHLESLKGMFVTKETRAKAKAKTKARTNDKKDLLN